MHGWQANLKRTCALPVLFRAMPENVKPPALRVDIYCLRKPLAERVDKELKLWTNKKACIIIKATDNRKKL